MLDQIRSIERNQEIPHKGSVLFDTCIKKCFYVFLRYYIVQLELIYYSTYFSPSSHPTLVCFFTIGLSLLIHHFQQVLRVLKFLLSPGLGSWKLEFKSLIIVIVGFENFVCCLVWAVYLGV